VQRSIVILIIVSGFFQTDEVAAWGRDAHRIVGNIAMSQIDETARQKLTSLLGKTDRRTIGNACNWPDQVRSLPEYEHALPWHYVNLPRWDKHYSRQRDCPDGNCAPEALKRFSARLADERLPRDQRIEAFNWICHLTADLHQPLHSGYADDRGGNEVEVNYRGRSQNLHSLWDTRLIRSNRPSWRRYSNRLIDELAPPENTSWSVEEVNHWTEEAHRLVQQLVYPKSAEIKSPYVSKAMPVIDRQLSLAGIRMARILNAVLGDGKLVTGNRASQ